MKKILFSGGKVEDGPTGQYQYIPTSYGVRYYFTIPEHVHSICMVAVGRGGFLSGQYHGGGLSWRNHIPVVPGERLECLHDHMDVTVTRESNGELLILVRGANSNYKSGLIGVGGKDASNVNDGGGNGGRGSGNVPGGAGGYLGNGGNAGTNFLPQAGSGAGAGARSTSQFGGGVGLLGIGPDGNSAGGDGSNFGGPVCGAGGTGTGKNRSGLRIIWGPNRYFPGTNTHNM